MFAIIHKHLRRDKVAIFISKSTFYRWLNGTKPMLWHIAALDDALHTETSLAYVFEFSNIALRLSQTLDTHTILEILSTSKLKNEDKNLLSDYHKDRIWRKLA